MPEADLLGRTEVTVAEIMGGRNWTVTKKLSGRTQNKDYGTVTVMGLKLEVEARSFCLYKSVRGMTQICR